MFDDALIRRADRGGQAGRTGGPTPAVRGAPQPGLPLDGADGRGGRCRGRDTAGISAGSPKDRPVLRPVPVHDVVLPTGSQRGATASAPKATGEIGLLGVRRCRSFAVSHPAIRTSGTIGRGAGAARFGFACRVPAAGSRRLSVSRHFRSARYRGRNGRLAVESSPPAATRAPHRTRLAAVAHAASLASCRQASGAPSRDRCSMARHAAPEHSVCTQSHCRCTRPVGLVVLGGPPVERDGKADCVRTFQLVNFGRPMVSWHVLSFRVRERGKNHEHAL